ncbi:hypothetical protein EYC80_007175 [Monilinia laxa]|uniref:Uncharacterized protein n=1 Tax=Monilinia laxa TaxID=61186 RepID=A0A5N6K0F1_MONLA|nr:hypothetical protein EYC80_007175 [Monilinia laxa]
MVGQEIDGMKQKKKHYAALEGLRSEDLYIETETAEMQVQIKEEIAANAGRSINDYLTQNCTLSSTVESSPRKICLRIGSICMQLQSYTFFAVFYPISLRTHRLDIYRRNLFDSNPQLRNGAVQNILGNHRVNNCCNREKMFVLRMAIHSKS